MSQKVMVPLTGTNVIPQGEAAPEPAQGVGRAGFEDGIYTPQSHTSNERSMNLARNGLGRTIQRSMDQRAGASARASTPAPAPSQPSQAEALQSQLNNLTQQVQGLVTNMANRQQSQAPQYGGYDQQYGQDDPQYPSPELDPINYDPYDPVHRLQHRTALDAHVKEAVQRAVEADRAAREQAATIEDIGRQCEAVRTKYGRDANYDEVANAAKGIHLNAGGELTVEQAYLQASREMEARSGRRGTSYLPKEIRTLGAIARYNQETGRAGQGKRGRR